MIASVILAAGHSRRFGAANKLLAEIDGKAMVTHVVETALAAALGPVIVVTGHEADDIRATLGSLDVTFIHNPDHATGMA